MTARTFGTCGLMCPACKRLLEARLESIHGVAVAEADVRLGKTNVVFDPSVVDEWTIAEAIHHAGFDVTVHPHRAGGRRW